MRLACSAALSSSRRSDAYRVTKHFDPDLVADQQWRLAGSETLRGRTHSEPHNLDRRLVTEDVDEGFAVSRGHVRGTLDRVVDEPLAADDQERHVTEILIRRPSQQPQRIGPPHQWSEPLPRTVPVEHEHEARPDVRDIPRVRGGRGLRSRPTVTWCSPSIGAPCRRSAADQVRGIAIEQRLEEGETPRSVDVGVGDGRGEVLDGEHHHMCVGGSKVVLDEHTPVSHTVSLSSWDTG